MPTPDHLRPPYPPATDPTFPIPILQCCSKVLDEIRDDAPPALQAVRVLAQYTAAPSTAAASALAQCEAWITDPSTSGIPAVQCVAATIFIAEGQHALALRAVRAHSCPEALALEVQALLRMDRPDLAERSLKALQEREDESTLYALSAGAVYLALGGDKYKEAVLVYKDLLDRSGEGAGARVANGYAAALMAARRFDDAEKVLSELLSRDENNADTLANMLLLLQHSGRGSEATTGKFVTALRRVAPGHPLAAALAMADGQFDRVAATFATA